MNMYSCKIYMKFIFSILFLPLSLFFCVVFAQTNPIKFESKLSWDEALIKAKKENKYIFIDANTSWCSPCREMSKNVFSNDSVGIFFNKNFINLNYQMDSTANDNENVKFDFEYAKVIQKKYDVIAFPTYLFFDSNGKLVHKEGGRCSVSDFLLKGHNALDSNSQYFALLEKFDKGNRIQSFLLNLSNLALKASDLSRIKEISYAFYKTQSNLLTEENLKYVFKMTTNINDSGYFLMKNYREKFLEVINEKEFNLSFVSLIINHELSKIYKDLESWSDEKWEVYKRYLKVEYPIEHKQVFFSARMSSLGYKPKMSKYIKIVNEYLEAGFGNPDLLNNFAWQVFLEGKSKEELNVALKWSMKSITQDGSKNPQFLDTYSNLLYKLGRKKEAIDWQLKAKKVAISNGEPKNWGDEVLKKMKAGVKTW
jgi:thioredoxin-related protein